jgi:hypothetical protein
VNPAAQSIETGVDLLDGIPRLPSSTLVDTTVSPIFLPIVPDRNPRTECGCQPVAFISSFAVAPPGRFSRWRIFAVLMPQWTLACVARLGTFLAGRAFFPESEHSGPPVPWWWDWVCLSRCWSGWSCAARVQPKKLVLYHELLIGQSPQDCGKFASTSRAKLSTGKTLT